MLERSPEGHSRLWQWDEPRRVTPDVRGPEEDLLDRAWRNLLIVHMPVHMLEGDGCSCLRRKFEELEQVFMKDPSLQWYYDATYLAQPEEGEEPSLPVPSIPQEKNRPRHVALLQAHFMEEAYQQLKLGRYANAPANRGWMNVFRRWGASPIFNEIFDQYRKLLTREFVSFYDNFVREYGATIDDVPVRHPWDPRLIRNRMPPAPDQDEVKEARLLVDIGIKPMSVDNGIPGVYLDSGLVETIIDEEAKTESVSTESASTASTTPEQAPAAPSNS